MKKVEQLIADVKKKILNSESRSVKFHGVSCTRADLEIIQMYAENYLRNGSFAGFMAPMGAVKEVFDKLDIK